MGRSPCCDESGVKKGPWTPEEDEKLVNYIRIYGHGSWRALPKLAGLNRCGKSCRLRWTNYLRPDIKRGKFSREEQQTILHLHSILGNKWSAIASHLPGRTDNEIKNFWNTYLKKKLIQMGFDPMTHQPRLDLFSSLPYLLALANMTKLMDHRHHHQSLDDQALRLQAEVVQLTKLQYLEYLLQSSTALNTNTTLCDQSSIPNMEAALNLTNPIASPVLQKESSMNISSSQHQENNMQASFPFENGDSQPQPLHHPSLPSHFSDPQVPFSVQTCLNNSEILNQVTNFTMVSQGNCQSDDTDHWAMINTSPAAPSVPPALTPSIVSSSSSYGTGGTLSSYWPQRLLDNIDIMHEIA